MLLFTSLRGGNADEAIQSFGMIAFGIAGLLRSARNDGFGDWILGTSEP
jgi:hypothetical protein